MKKRILYITTLSRTVNAFLLSHIEELIKNGYVVDIACKVDKPIDISLINLGVKVYDVSFTRNPLDIKNIKAFRELIKIHDNNRYDIVHVHTPIASIYGRLLKLKDKNIKTIYTAHGYHFLQGGAKVGWILYYPIEKVMAKLTDVTITINKEDYDITINRLKPKKTYLINGVGLDLNSYKEIPNEEIVEIKESLDIDMNDFVIIMIAELNENKNQIQLINAMKIIADEYKNIKVLFVGEGQKLNDLNKVVLEERLDKQVKFLGFRNDINKLINVSDLGVLLSYREGLPRNIMELMANGKPIICTDIRGNRDLVKNGYNGYLVKVGDCRELADKIISLYKNKEKYLELCENSKREIKKYDITIVLDKLLDIYMTI